MTITIIIIILKDHSNQYKTLEICIKMENGDGKTTNQQSTANNKKAWKSVKILICPIKR